MPTENGPKYQCLLHCCTNSKYIDFNTMQEKVWIFACVYAVSIHGVNFTLILFNTEHIYTDTKVPNILHMAKCTLFSLW